MRLVALRAAALLAALVLTLLSRGDVLVLAVLLVVGAWRPLPGLAVASALFATAWRWSSTALEDIAGAQAVLGPAGLVDPPTAAAAAWLGALAIVLMTPDLLSAATGGRWTRLALRWLPPLAGGVTAAAVVAGPSWGSDPGVRLGGTVAAVALAYLRWPATGRPRARRWLAGRQVVMDVVVAVAGVAALGLVAVGAPPLDDLVDPDALVEGVVVAVAVALLAAAVMAAVHVRATHRP